MRIWEHLPKGCLEPCQTCVMELNGPKRLMVLECNSVSYACWTKWTKYNQLQNIASK